MSNTIQSLDSIVPAAGAQAKTATDPVQSEYEEGKEFLSKESYGQAAVALHNALLGFEEKNDENGIANASNQLGHLCLARKEFDTALNHYQRAYEICDSSNDRMSVLAVLQKMVAANRGLERYKKAIAICLDILDHYQDNRDPKGTVQTLEEMAEIYLADGDRAKAADTYRTVASIHSNFNHKNIAAGFITKAEELEG